MQGGEACDAGCTAGYEIAQIRYYAFRIGRDSSLMETLNSSCMWFAGCIGLDVVPQSRI